MKMILVLAAAITVLASCSHKEAMQPRNPTSTGDVGSVSAQQRASIQFFGLETTLRIDGNLLMIGGQAYIIDRSGREDVITASSSMYNYSGGNKGFINDDKHIVIIYGSSTEEFKAAQAGGSHLAKVLGGIRPSNLRGFKCDPNANAVVQLREIKNREERVYVTCIEVR